MNLFFFLFGNVQTNIPYIFTDYQYLVYLIIGNKITSYMEIIKKYTY